MKFRVPRDRRQTSLLPRSVDEFVPANDIARFVDMMVDEMDLGEIESRYSENGRPAYSPRVLVKLLIYGKIRRVRSSRELARAARENLSFVFLTSGETPDFRTISLFRKRFSKELAGLLKQTIDIGMRQGVVDLETVAIDGTIKRASAGMGSFRSEEKLLKMLEASIQADAKVDDEEDKQQGDDEGPKLPDELTGEDVLRERIRSALRQFQDRPKGSKPLKQVSLTDPECRVIHSVHGKFGSYNAQAGVDAKHGFVVMGYVTNTSDGSELARALKEIASNTGQNPRIAVADAGYSSFEGLRALNERGVDGYVNQPQSRSSTLPRDQFEYVESERAYRCPEGRWLRRKTHISKQRQTVYVSEGCDGCSLRERCLENLHPGTRRYFYVHDDWPLRDLMAKKVRSEFGSAMMRLRSATVERLFGHQKWNRGISEFLFRGLQRVDDDWKFTLAVGNLEILFRESRR
ncbi:MAG: IS1182 family transposase [Candidatus Eisenbacteria bacterium]